jgi:CBS domain-containing protein
MSTGACDNEKVSREDGGELRVRDVMVRRPKTLPADATVADLRRMFANGHVATALLVDGTRFAGAVQREEMPEAGRDEAPALDLARRDVDTIAPDASVAAALAQMDEGEERRLVVLDADGETLRGLLCLTTDRSGFCQS